MKGPVKWPDHTRAPIRGDLAHIALAGRYLVPHYAVPQPRPVVKATTLCVGADKPEDNRGQLAEGTIFDCLDIAGEWAWGIQHSDAEDGLGGLVGWVRLEDLGAPDQ
ncbi:SH3 domain-containing protein [Pseudoblastomonas halimionae]|uniref:SH3 domain-containing protein n=1 Tax=Alteriqipengyuania halimionae TaxID=1926630 RepID=UPI001F489EED|nr:SH3 domain-containing protein [Alteriqipengyuania halimionae]